MSVDEDTNKKNNESIYYSIEDCSIGQQNISNLKRVSEVKLTKQNRIKLNWKPFLCDQRAIKDSIDFKGWNKMFTQEEREFVELDLTRTRRDEKFLQNPKVLYNWKLLIIFYCRKNHIKYQQGMLELMVPFLLLKNKYFPLDKCYAYFNSFMRKFFPNILHQKIVDNQSDLPHLIAAIQLCQELIFYHSPKILYIMKKFDIDIKIIVIPWLMTLFVKDTKIDFAYLILDHIITKNSKIFLFFLAIALIIMKEDEIFKYENELEPTNLIIFLTTSLKQLDTTDSLIKWFNKAEQLEKATPKSFCSRVDFLGFNDKSMMSKQDVNVLIESENDNILTVYPFEIVNFLLNTAERQNLNDSRKNHLDSNLEFILLDLRDNSEAIYIKFSRKICDYGFHLEKNKIQDLSQFLDQFSDIFHICLMVSHTTVNQKGKYNQEYQLMVQLCENLQAKGRKFVSKLAGGFNGLMEEIQKRQKENVLLAKNKQTGINSLISLLKNMFV